MPRKQPGRGSASKRASGVRGGNTLRIIAGQWRGRKLPFPDQQGLRPTPDRVRETLFNWLQPVIPGSRCLDLFSGSGALGLEALSRGAASAVLVDSSTAVVGQLRRNLQLLNADNAEVVQSSAQSWLAHNQQLSAGFDLVFLDPPFRQGMLEQCCELLEQSELLSPGARIYVEAEKELSPLPLPQNWQLLRQKDCGQLTSYLLLRNDSRDEPTESQNAPGPVR